MQLPEGCAEPCEGQTARPLPILGSEQLPGGPGAGRRCGPPPSKRQPLIPLPCLCSTSREATNLPFGSREVRSRGAALDAVNMHAPSCGRGVNTCSRHVLVAACHLPAAAAFSQRAGSHPCHVSCRPGRVCFSHTERRGGVPPTAAAQEEALAFLLTRWSCYSEENGLQRLAAPPEPGPKGSSM